jgi:hypothetical protein
MLRLAFACSLLLACGGGGDDPPGVDAPVSAACQEATTYQDLATIEDKIFKPSCIFSGCHNGANTPAGQLDLRAGMSHASLVDVASQIEPARRLVVAGDPAKSYLLLMMGAIAPGDADPPGNPPPANIGLMPQGTGGILLCPEKRDAVERWIAQGALDN